MTEYKDFVTYCASLYAKAGVDVTTDADNMQILKDSALNMLIEKEVMLQKARELGLDELSDSETAALNENYDEMIAELL